MSLSPGASFLLQTPTQHVSDLQVLSECRQRMAELETQAEALRKQTLLVDGPGM